MQTLFQRINTPFVEGTCDKWPIAVRRRQVEPVLFRFWYSVHGCRKISWACWLCSWARHDASVIDYAGSKCGERTTQSKVLPSIRRASPCARPLEAGMVRFWSICRYSWQNVPLRLAPIIVPQSRRRHSGPAVLYPSKEGLFARYLFWGS
jgi:hypothetical protein